MKVRLLPVILALVCTPLVAAELVVIVHPDNATVVNQQVLSSVYLGRTEAFDPVDLPASDPLTAHFYQQATGRDLAQVKTIWSRLALSSRAQPPKELPNAQAVKQAVAANPRGIGYIPKESADASVKVVMTLGP